MLTCSSRAGSESPLVARRRVRGLATPDRKDIKGKRGGTTTLRRMEKCKGDGKEEMGWESEDGLSGACLSQQAVTLSRLLCLQRLVGLTEHRPSASEAFTTPFRSSKRANQLIRPSPVSLPATPCAFLRARCFVVIWSRAIARRMVAHPPLSSPAPSS